VRDARKTIRAATKVQGNTSASDTSFHVHRFHREKQARARYFTAVLSSFEEDCRAIPDAVLADILRAEQLQAQVCTSILVSIVTQIPEALMPNLLATVAPLQHLLGPSATRTEIEVLRLAFAMELLCTAHAVLNRPSFPASWMSMQLLCVSFPTKIHRWIGSFIASCYRGNDWAKAFPLWEKFIDLSLHLLTCPIISPEMLSPTRRRFILESVGDLRPEIGMTMRLVWGSPVCPLDLPPLLLPITPPQVFLDPTGATKIPEADEAANRTGLCTGNTTLDPILKMCLAPRLVAPLLDLTHCSSDAVATLARDMYFDLIRAELICSEMAMQGGAVANDDSPKISSRARGLPEIERLTIDAIHTLVERKGPSLVYQEGVRSLAGFLDHPAYAMTKPKTQPEAPAGGTGGNQTASNFRGTRVAMLNSTRMMPVSQDVSVKDDTSTKRPESTGYAPPPSNLIMSLFGPAPAGLNRVDSTLFSVDDLVDSSKGWAELLSDRVVMRFFAEIRTLYAMLSSVSQYPVTSEFEDERTKAALTLVGYLRRTHRSDMYTRFVTFMRDMHLSLGNSVEAAFAYLLHADILDWSDTVLPESTVGDKVIFQEQTSAERLEMIISNVMDELVMAKCWESALDLSNMLLRRYQHVTIEYTKAARLMRSQGTYYEYIATKPRIYSSYFVVHYKGYMFPEGFRRCAFVYRGEPGERLANFEARMCNKWAGVTKVLLQLEETLPQGTTFSEPNSMWNADKAHVKRSNSTTSESFGEDGNHNAVNTSPLEIGIGAVVPLSTAPIHPVFDLRPLPLPTIVDSSDETVIGDARNPLFSMATSRFDALDGSFSQVAGKDQFVMKDRDRSVSALATDMDAALAREENAAKSPYVPRFIRQGQENTNLRIFMQQRPFRKRAEKTDNPILDTWVARQYIFSAAAFPGIQRCSAVAHIHHVVLNPLEFAIATLQKRNLELVDSIENAAAGPDRGADQEFTSSLQGVVDAAVSGGVTNYKPFLTGGYRTTHPEIYADLQQGHPAKGEAVAMLKAALLEQTKILARGIRVHSHKCSIQMLPLHEFLCKRFEDFKNTMRELGILAA
jgi:hypothetical protein